jgi:hypothetical protein
VKEGKLLPILGRKSCEATKLIQRVHTIADEDIFSGLGCLLGYEYAGIRVYWDTSNAL